MFEISGRIAHGEPVSVLLIDPCSLEELVAESRMGGYRSRRTSMEWHMPGRREAVEMMVTAGIPEDLPDRLVLEVVETDTRTRAAREQRMRDLAHENRQVLRNLAHEVKNPLGGIRGAAQLLRPGGSDSEMADCTDIIIKETDRLQSLVDRLMQPHRQPKRAEPVNIHEVSEHVCRLVAAEYSAALELIRDYDTSLPEILVDREQMIQALLNLMRNAAQALGGSGRIDLVTRVARQVNIERTRHKLALELHVIDNGPGIDPEIRDRVFLPLVTGRAEGTGLGLALVQSFVQQNGGVIDVDSEPGRTDFQLLFPFHDG